MVATETKQRPLELRILFLIGRFMAALLCVLYLLMTLNSIPTWAQTLWVRQQPVSAVESILQESLAKNDPQILFNWVMRRPQSNMADIFPIVEKQAGQINSLIFMRQARYLAKNGQVDEATFWYLYTRYRLRYDALRCGTPTGTEKMDMILEILSPSEMNISVPPEPQKLAPILQRVLDVDAKNPARNNPADICTVVQKISGGNFVMVPEESWAAIRHTLRMVTEQSIAEMTQ